MNPALITLFVVVFIALLVLQQVVFERNLRRARENRTGLYRYSPPVRRVIVVALLLLLIVFDIATWH